MNLTVNKYNNMLIVSVLYILLQRTYIINISVSVQKSLADYDPKLIPTYTGNMDSEEAHGGVSKGFLGVAVFPSESNLHKLGSYIP